MGRTCVLDHVDLGLLAVHIRRTLGVVTLRCKRQSRSRLRESTGARPGQLAVNGRVHNLVKAKLSRDAYARPRRTPKAANSRHKSWRSPP